MSVIGATPFMDSANAQQADAAASAGITIHSMTSVDVNTGSGYFQDPYPIHTLSRDARLGPPVFAGTNPQLLSCNGPLHPRCFTASALSLKPGPIAERVAAAGARINNFENLNIYQDDTGAWQMAVTAHLTFGTGNGWNVILHAHPVNPGSGVPTEWEADTLLVGKLDQPAPDNYDGKYFSDEGTLYLLYNKKVGPGQDGVVAQVMASPTQKAAFKPVPLLGPETADGGYNSELADGLNQPNTVKLIETGNITKIGGKYVMTYSVGTFNRPDYKAGIAWSDTFLPSGGAYYRRVLETDKNGVWGQPGHAEVKYLLQAQIQAWPNYVRDQVLAPGVPAIIKDADQKYYLTFAGYAPSDAPLNAKNLYIGTHRRPFYIPLKVDVPSNTRVSDASDQGLAHWVEPATAGK